MPRRKSLRRRPSTPNLRLHQHTADPASPPETPTTSPLVSRKSSLKPRHQPPFFDFSQPLTQDPSIKPVGNGHQFSYQPALAADQLSPRSSSSSSSPPGDSVDDDLTDSASIGSLPNSSGPGADLSGDDDVSIGDASGSDSDESDDAEDGNISSVHIRVTSEVVCDFTIEDVDPHDPGHEGLEVLYPTEIESNRSRSRSRHKDHLDTSMMQDLKNLNCSNEASDNDVEPDYEEEAFLRRQQELKRIRRVSMSSSFGKRTHSELSDSDDDTGFLDVNDVGFSARHMRKRLHRGSLLFQDPPAPRIDELDEPDSSEDEFVTQQSSLAAELPYWTMEIMEVDSS
ncbi:hypothetical protein HJFPF1_12735 [Paramyrothecium foliicola]|nr:hypothetical protein HJFPF1_12735 [Paramyrothecium foliicola]